MAFPLLLSAGFLMRPSLSPVWWDVCRGPLELVGYFSVPAEERAEAVREGANAAVEGAMWAPVETPSAPYGLGYIPPWSFVGAKEELAQIFKVEAPIRAVAPHTPTWFTKGSGCTVEVFRLEGESWRLLARRRFRRVRDNSWPTVEFPPQPPGVYKWRIVEPEGRIGAWARLGDYHPEGRPIVDGNPQEGFDFETRITTMDGTVVELIPSGEPHFSIPLGSGVLQDWERLGVRVGFYVGNWNNGHFPYYPDWFFRKFPDCPMLDQDGKPFLAGMFGRKLPWVSICHPAIVEGTKRFITAVARALKGSPALAYWVMGGESLYPTYSFPGRWADYSRNAILHFRAWLGERYGRVEALNAAWGTNYKGFEEVEPPRPPGRDLPSLDWHRFRLHAMAERIRWHYAAIRAEDKRRPILSCNHGDLRRLTELGADPALYASVSDGFETGQIIVGDDPLLFNLLYFRFFSSFGRPICPARLAYKLPDPKARGGGRSFTPEAVRRYVYECLGCGAWHVGLVQWSGSLPDGEWGIKGTPAFLEARKVFAEILRIRPWLDRSWPVKPKLAVYLPRPTWALWGFRPAWLEAHRELARRHIPAEFVYDPQVKRGDLRDYETLLLVDAPAVPEAALKAIYDFLQRGGTFLVGSKFAELDENLRLRKGLKLPGRVVRAKPQDPLRALRELLPKVERWRPFRLAVSPSRKPVFLEEFRTVKWAQRNLAEDMSGKKSLGQTVRLPGPVRSILISTPTYLKRCEEFGFILRVRLGGPEGEVIAEKRVNPPIADNAWHELKIPRDDPPGTVYYIEVIPDEDLPPRTLGWWGRGEDIYPEGTAFVDGRPVAYDREVVLKIERPLPEEAAVEAFLLSDGTNPALVLVNVTDGMAKVEGVMDDSLLRDEPGKYRAVELISGSEVGRGLRFGLSLKPHGTAVVFFERQIERAKVERMASSLKPAIERLDREGFLTPVMRALWEGAREHLEAGRPSKALALLRLLSNQLGIRVEQAEWRPTRGLRLEISLRSIGGEPLEGAEVEAELVPLYGLKLRFAPAGRGRFVLFLPANNVPKAYDYKTKRYLPYRGPVEALVEARHQSRGGWLRIPLLPL